MFPSNSDAPDRAHPFAEAVADYRRALLGMMAFNAVVATLAFSVPVFTMQVYDRVLSSGSHATLVALLAITLVLLIGQGVVEALRGQYLARSAVLFDRRIGPALMARCLRLSTVRPGASAARGLADARRLRDALGGQTVVALSELPFATLFLGACFLFHPMLGWTALAGMALVGGLAVLLHRTNAAALEGDGRNRGEEDALGHRLIEDSAGLRAAGAMAGVREAFLSRRAEATLRGLDATERLAVSQVVTRTVRLAVQVAITAVGALLVIDGSLSPGMLIATTIVAGKALAPIDQLAGQWRAVVAAREAFARVERLFATVPNTGEGSHDAAVGGALTLDEVAVNAPGSRRRVVEGVSLRAPPGATLAITGCNGGGKSLLLAAIGNGRPLAEGTIRLDGVPLDHWNPTALGRRVGYLPQRVELLPGTLAQNIARFGPVDRDDLARAVERAGASELIAQLPRGVDSAYPTDVPDLSAGLLRRIGLARALYGDPALLLLDEPLSDLDAAGRNRVVELVRRLKAQGRTQVLVTPVPSLLALCDGGLVVEGGRARTVRSATDLLAADRSPQRARRA